MIHSLPCLSFREFVELETGVTFSSTDKSRLIERAFPLKQTSLPSVHKKCPAWAHIHSTYLAGKAAFGSQVK